jgi:hypothetical protein
VNNVPFIAPDPDPDIKAWCAHVIVAPDDSSNTVLRRGSSKGLIASIPKGGQAFPNSTVGFSAL